MAALLPGAPEQALTGGRPAPPWPAALDDDADTDRIDRRVSETTHDRPRAEPLRAARRTWDRLEEVLATLVDPGQFPWLADEALGPAVVRDATAHCRQDREADVRA